MTQLQKSADIDYSRVNQYWNNARPSIMGPYMMDGFGFPASAGRFRFCAEKAIVQQLIKGINCDGTVLDLGCGIGYWTEYFAQNFQKVIAIESSSPLYAALKQQCLPYSNVETIHANVEKFEPEESYKLVFLGGMLMYLNENDVTILLRKIIPSLEPGSIVLCRETTVRKGVVTRRGEYQAVYRSVKTYENIFRKCGFDVISVQKNEPYILMQMGCELIKKWKSILPEPLQLVPIAGRFVYWGLRLGNPWVMQIAKKLGIDFPELENHFFVLRVSNRTSLNK
jgi:trans-aconitate methyltransferase